MTDHQLDAVLCYVKWNCAHFTTQELSKQWGDDWGDKPWEHNAGQPYAPYLSASKVVGRNVDNTPIWGEATQYTNGKPNWEIVEIYYHGPFITPDDGHWNSPYSVEEINAGAVPWLRSEDYHNGDDAAIEIPAGTTLREFVQLVGAAGGKLWFPATEAVLITELDPA